MNRAVPIGVAQESVPQGVHLCYIYSDDGERGRTMAKFLERGLAENARLLCLLDSVTPHDIRAYLSELGVDLAARADAMVIGDAEKTYLPDGKLDPDTLLDNLSAFCQHSVSQGYSGVRITGDMAWVKRHADLSKVMEYEVKATEHARTQQVVAVCEYDARKFDGRTIMDVLSVHPSMIVGGQVVKNPYYLEPKEFLARYRTRGGTPARA